MALTPIKNLQPSNRIVSRSRDHVSNGSSSRHSIGGSPSTSTTAQPANILLIPQGSKLIGVYDSQISFGQDRVLLVWTRLIMPNGRSIVLERQPGADTQGFAGLEDEVDHHWGRLFTAAAISTLLGVGAELGAANNDSRALQELRALAMAKLKLSAVADDRPVKLTVELPAAVHRDLVVHAELLARQNGQKIEPTKL